ncbi:MAG TPA: thiol:disulfide interchange protein DsbA/DsbL [Tahibacter sp.]|nr:thiol:disulfide interchange protein DsbA/DsbL [Tahibacter sp.]
MFQRFLIALAALPLAAAAQAPAPAGAPTTYVEGKHYELIDPPVQTADPAKIEVTEVFSYGCPACAGYAPIFKKLKAKLPANTIVTYVPASFNTAEKWPLFQRAYYAAQALGVADKAHDDVFPAVWGENGPLKVVDQRTRKPVELTLEDVAKFYEKYGVSAADFVATANSFSVNTKMKKADAYLKATQVSSTPTLVVNGKYRLVSQELGSWEALDDLVLFLVRKESAGK